MGGDKPGIGEEEGGAVAEGLGELGEETPHNGRRRMVASSSEEKCAWADRLPSQIKQRHLVRSSPQFLHLK